MNILVWNMATKEYMELRYWMRWTRNILTPRLNEDQWLDLYPYIK